MAETITIARPYAQAVFQLARESGTLAEWSARLQRLALIAADPEMIRLIGDPKLSAREVAELFVSLSGEPDNREIASLAGLLAENGRFDVLGEIGEIFEQLKIEAEGVSKAVITSAFPLDKAQLKPLMAELEAHFGCRLQAEVEVDPALIGGVRVAVGDRILDASVRGKLDAMSVALKN